MRSYALSEDGANVVFVSSNAERGRGEGGRKVSIATYSDRFMQVREVPRTVSDDPIGDVDTAIYLYRLPAGEHDDGVLSASLLNSPPPRRLASRSSPTTTFATPHEFDHRHQPHHSHLPVPPLAFGPQAWRAHPA